MNRKLFLSRNRLLPLLIVAALVIYQYYQADNEAVDAGLQTDGDVVEQAFAAQRSGLWLETSGRVIRILKDDNEGARHQKFILKLDGGHSVLVAQWNDRGGVIHWTHHDPDGREQGGWIEVGDVRYE